MTIAGSYHAGKFLRPHGRTGKVYFPEDGTVYFRADPERYGAIKPVAKPHRSRARHAARTVRVGRIGVNVWLVLLHNTRLGEAHPELTVANAFGDRYVYSLCPVRAGGARLCARPLPGRHRELSGARACRWRRRGFCPMRMASITSSR